MFGKRKEEMMVYVVMGFLEAGKTSLVRDLIVDDMFDDKIKTLILACEEGEEEYEEADLKKGCAVCEYIEDEESFNGKVIQKFLKKHRPDRIIIEYNGMWKLEDLLSIRYPRSFELQGVYSTVNGTTLDMYLMNMRNMLMEQLTESELIVVNRCADGVNRSGFRRALKVQNLSLIHI